MVHCLLQAVDRVVAIGAQLVSARRALPLRCKLLAHLARERNAPLSSGASAWGKLGQTVSAPSTCQGKSHLAVW